MLKTTKYIIAIMWLALLGIGIGNASADCGDGAMEPINVHSKAKAANKDS